ncbi:hypothetical protein HRbin12_01849 [bacterium HR12]|nr:hypothetical protein HRbin12_01849 [bacterium HR12]GIV00502.1 MAG: hypothetical protein KatS3mg014_2117 [Actinomycetota bacterium]
MLAETVPLIEQGSVQFILFGVMVLAVFITLWLTLPR